MNVGKILYYLLWPFVGIAKLINLLFMGISFLFGLGFALVENLHEDIKEM